MQMEPTVKTKLELVTASEIETKKVQWLWYPYFLLGKVSIVQGNLGGGKSTFLLTIAAKLTNGDILPFSEPDTPPEPMKVIYQPAEDINKLTLKIIDAPCRKVMHNETR